MFRRALIMLFLVAIVRYIVVACPGTEKQLKKTEEIKCVLFFIMTTEKCKMFPRTLITLFLVAIVRYTASICLRTQKQKQIKKTEEIKAKWTTTPYEKNYFKRNASKVVALSVFQSQNYFQIKSALDETLLNQAGKENATLSYRKPFPSVWAPSDIFWSFHML